YRRLYLNGAQSIESSALGLSTSSAEGTVGMEIKRKRPEAAQVCNNRADLASVTDAHGVSPSNIVDLIEVIKCEALRTAAHQSPLTPTATHGVRLQRFALPINGCPRKRGHTDDNRLSSLQ